MSADNKGASFFLTVVLPSSGIPDKPSYTLDETSRLLQVSRRTLNAMMVDGRLPQPFCSGKGGGGWQSSASKRYYRETLIKYFEKWDGQLSAQSVATDKTKKRIA